MSTSILQDRELSVCLPAPSAYLEPRWYAAHTRSRHEKRVAEQLAGRKIEFFLPLYQARHRWKDRIAEVELPLFPGYVFVHIPLKDRCRVQDIASVAKLVTFQGLPAPLPTAEIEALRAGLAARLKASPLPYLKLGHRVCVKNGPLTGAEGILLRKKDKCRLVISLELIMRSVAVEVDAADVQPLP